MKKGFKTYALIWAVLLVIFNVICFATPNEMAGYTKLDATFWTAYIFMTLAFIGQLACAYKAFTAADAQRLFYNIPLITISYSGLVLMLIIGAAAIAIPGLPSWLAVIAGVVILGFTAIAVIKAGWAANAVSKVDERVAAQTSFIKSLIVDTESILSRAKSDAVKAECKKVHEAVRYSDPMSNDALSVIEAKITVKVDEFSSAVGVEDAEKAKEIADEIVILVADRNKKCKVLK